MKRIILLLLLSLTSTLQLLAQSIQTDSTLLKTKLAIIDAKRFRMNKQIRQAYRKKPLTPTSDYFNPTTQTTSNLGFLKDSVYVNTYKKAAYNNSIRNIKLNRTIVISSIVIGLVLIPIVVAKGFNSLLSDARSTM